jgi:glycosyltransferase involved in cell wall biosynthesis
MGPNSISAAVVARNEEAVLDRCLASLDGVVDEIVLVHDGDCDDASLEIAERHGARIFVQPQTGSPELQTVFAYHQARGEWLLNIDADEYLSDELRASLRELVGRPDVNGYAFLWRQWDGERYLTEDGPYKLVLFRREAVHMLGMNEALEQVDGRVEQSRLELEHRPLYNNFVLRVVFSKWRRRARIQARQYLTDFADLPKFNWRGPDDWPRWRLVSNALSPLLFVPYGLATFAAAFYRDRSNLAARENARLAFYMGLYAGMVQFYVAKFRYFGDE